MYHFEAEQLYQKWINKTLSSDWHVELMGIYEKDKANFQTYLYSDLKEAISKNDYTRTNFWIMVVAMIYPIENQAEELKVSELFCEVMAKMMYGIETVNYQKAVERSSLIYWVEDTIGHNMSLADVNAERVAEVSAMVCRLDYRKEEWTEHHDEKDSSKYDRYYMMANKALWVLTMIDNNQTALNAIKECLFHFDVRIVEEAQEYCEYLNKR